MCFAYRWHPPPAMATALASDPEMKARWDEATLWELCLLPMGPYVAWALLYYLKVFVISSKKISDKGYETLFSWMTSKKGGFASLVLRFPRPMQPLAYISMHFALTLAAMSVNVLWWSNQSACSAVIVGAFAVAAWNGASFYFEVFLHRYLAGLGMEQRRQQSKSPAPASAVSQAGQDVTSRPKGE